MAPASAEPSPNDPPAPSAKGVAKAALATPSADQEKATAGDLGATAALAGMFIVAILLAVILAKPSLEVGLEQFEDPDDPLNVLVYIGLILVFTFVMLWLAKRGIKWVIRFIVLGAVASSVLFVALPLLHQLAGLGPDLSVAISIALGVLTALLLYFHPEWYVIDTVGVLVAAGAASIFGISFGIVPVVLLLVGLAIYDAIAVYKTRHMLALADSVIELRLPILLVVPKRRGYHFRDEAASFKEARPETKGERGAMFMGLGDLVMPTILVVSALVFLPAAAHPFGGVETEGDLPVDVQVYPGPATSDGQSATIDITTSRGAQPTWAYTLDWDRDNGVDLEGQGLPARLNVTYDRWGGYIVEATATSGDDTGSAVTTLWVGVVSDAWHAPIQALFKHPAALGAAIGTLVGYAALMRFVLKGNPQAGLPLLNGGSIVGFLVGLYLQTGSLRFW